MSRPLPRLSWLTLWALLFAWLLALPAFAASLKADNSEIAVGEEVVVTIAGKPFIAMVGDWEPGENLQLLQGDSDRARFKGIKAGNGVVKVSINGKTYKTSVKVLGKPDNKDGDNDAAAVKLEGLARAMGMPDLDVRIARMLFEVNTGKRSPKQFYEGLAAAGGKMTDVINVRKRLVDHPDQSFTRQIMGPTFSENGTPVEQKILTWRRAETLAAIDEVVKQFVDAGRTPANGFELIISHVGKWANQADRSLTFTGDIDFSFVSNDTALAEAMKEAYAKVIERRTKLNQTAIDSVATAHGKAGLEVYIGRHGMAFAEEQLKINEVVDMTTGNRTRIEGDGAAMRVGAILTIERQLADAAGIETKQPVLNTEPGLSMEMARHFQHDIVQPRIFDLSNAVVKAAKYLDRSYKALDKAGGQPANAGLAHFAQQITELANAKPQTKVTRDNMIRLISDHLGSPPQTVWDMGTNKLVLTIDAAAVERFHQDAGKALWDTVRQGSNARTNELDGRLRDLLERQGKGDKVDDDVAKLRQEMVDLVDMVEAELKAAHGADIPIEVRTNNAKVRAMLDTLSKRFGVKTLSAEELKDKKFVEELLNAEAKYPDPSRLKMVAGYIMERTARAAELSMSGVEKSNQLLDIIDDRLLGPLRGDADFAEFEAEMKQVRQASMDPRLRSETTSRLSVLKTKVSSTIKGTNLYLNEKLQATAAGRQGMKFMMVYGLVDEMQAYRDAYSEKGWGGFATEIFKRRIPFGGAVESAVMGNTLRAGWDVVTTLIPPFGLPEAAWGLGTTIGTQVRSTYWNEQLALFTDGLYADAIFKLEEVQTYEGAKVGQYRLVRTFHNNMPLDLHRFAEMRKDQVEALNKEVEAGHVNWQAYIRNFNGLTEWLDVDATLKANLAASDPALQLLEEMANHEAVGKLLLDRLAEKGLARWDQVKFGYVVKLIKHLEDRKQADDALGRGMLPDLFTELRKVAADLAIEDEVMKGLDAEVDTSNLKKLVNWLWDVKRGALGQAPTESETTRAAQVVKKYLDTYKQIQSLRDQAASHLAKAATDVNTRYLTSNLFLSGRAEPDLAAARAWTGQIESARKAMANALLAIKRTFLPKAGLDSADQPYLDRAFAHEAWIKPYQDGNTRLKKAWMKDYAAGHIKERDKVLAEYKDWLTKLGPVQLTATAVDAKDARKTVGGLKIALTPTDELGKPVSASAAGNQVVMAVPMGRYTLTASAPGYLDATRSVVYGRGLTATPSETLSLTPSGKDPDKDKDKDKDVKPDDGGQGGTTVIGPDGKPAKPAKQGAGGSASGQFPGEPFNGMQISYSFSGCSLPEMKDKPGFTTSRIYKGRLGNGSMTVSGTARMGAGYGATLSVSVNAGGEHKEYSTYIKSGSPGYNTASFNLTIPIPVSATSGGFGIRMDGEYNAGGRGLAVYGSCTADGPEGEAPKGTGELDVSISGPNTPVPLGKEAEVNASAKGGRFPYSYSWTGAVGANERAKAKITRPGSQQVAVTVSDSEGKRAGANLTIKVAPLKLELAGLPGQAYYGSRSRLQINGLPDFQPPPDPCAGRAYTSSNPYDECIRVKVDPSKAVSVAPQFDDANPPPPITASANTAPRPRAEAKEGAYRLIWQSEPGLTFEPPTSSDGTTWVTYDRMGQIKVWCEVHQMIEGAWQTIGETDQKTVNVVATAFSLQFTPPDGQGKVGQEVRVKIVAKPEVPGKLIDYRWFDPASGNRMEYTQNAGEIGFKVKDAKPMKLDVLARVPHHGDEIAKIAGTYTGAAYDVKISPPKARGPQLQVWVCDTQLGNAKNCGMKDIPQGQFATFQDIFLTAQVTPAPQSPRYRWTVDPSGSCGLPGAGSELRLNCSNTGSYTVRLEVTDADNLLLGQAETGVSVSVSDNDVRQAPKSKEADDKMQQAKQQANDGQLDEAINLAAAAAGLDPKNTEAKDLGKRWNDERKTVRQQVDRARKALQGNKPDDAQKEIDAAKKLHPKYPPVLDAEKQLADKRKGQGISGRPPVETGAMPAAVGASAIATASGNVAGKWRSSEGEITLTQSGRAVKGGYNNDGGEIVGEMNGNVLEGYWIENSSGERCATAKNGRYHWGRIRWTFDGGKFIGNWSYCDKPVASGGGWNGERSGDVPPGYVPPANSSASAPPPGGAAAASPQAGGGLIAAYALDGDARDASGNNRHGSIQGARATADRFGRAGGAMLFDGKAYIELPLDINPGNYPRLTFTAWVRADDASPTRQVMSHDNGSYDRSLGIDPRGGGTGWSAFAGTGGVLGFKPVEKGRWTFVAGVWDQTTRKVRLMVDDTVMEKSGEIGGSDRKLSLGRNPGYGEYFVGAIDDVRLYDRALDPSEIRTVRGGASSGGVPPTADVGGLAGTWAINANGYTGKLELSDSAGRLSGRVWFDAHGVWEDLRGFSFDGRTLRFLRPGPNQRYTGTYSGSEVRGSFDGGGNWNWSMTRTGASIAPTGTPRIAEFAWHGMNEDRVGDWGNGQPNGTKDGHFRLTLDAPGKFALTSLSVWSANENGEKSGGQIWHTKNGNNWMLGVFHDGRQLNASHVANLGEFPGRVELDLYTNSSGWFNPGQWFLVEAEIANGMANGKANGTMIRQTLKLGSVSPPPIGGAGRMNLARGKPASQSSTSPWSRANDAQGAVDGVINGGYGFHTNGEATPWWQVDLGGQASIDEVRLFNRLDCCAERARTMQLMLSDDGRQWRMAYRHGGSAFGGQDGKSLKVQLNGASARYIRLQLNETNWFHLDEVEVYGRMGDSASIPGGRDYTGYDSPVATPDSRSGTGHLRIEACVDGSDWISLDNGRLNHRHRAFDQIGTHGGCPASHKVAGGGFLVDGLAVGLSRLPMPVGMAGIGRFEVERGRGQVRLDGANRVLIDDDGPSGSDVYILRLYPSAAATGTPAVATIPGGRDYTAAPVQGQLIFEVGNIGGVGNGPAKATKFTLAAPHVITLIRDYHWNSARGAAPGSIALKGKDGGSHGPWQATGSPGQGGVPDAYWTAYPNITLPAGTYTVIDSDPATWSHNAESNNRGFVRVEGYPADAQVDGTIKEVDGLLDAVRSLKGLFGK